MNYGLTVFHLFIHSFIAGKIGSDYLKTLLHELVNGLYEQPDLELELDKEYVNELIIISY